MESEGGVEQEGGDGRRQWSRAGREVFVGKEAAWPLANANASTLAPARSQR